MQRQLIISPDERMLSNVAVPWPPLPSQGRGGGFIHASGAAILLFEGGSSN
jgi:hypothetical protein